jgi:tripartite-type tricarboxylate transporter receptor subunit TctC
MEGPSIPGRALLLAALVGATQAQACPSRTITSGISIHMSAELFKQITRIDIVYVPYKGRDLTPPNL